MMTEIVNCKYIYIYIYTNLFVFQNATVHETPCVQHLFGYARWRNLYFKNWSHSEIMAFWNHLMGFDEWSAHPVLNDNNVDKRRQNLS